MEIYSYIYLCSTNFDYVHYVLVCEVCNPLSMFLGSFTTCGELCLMCYALVYLNHCLCVLVELFAYVYISVLLQWSLSRYARFKSLSIWGPTLCETMLYPLPLTNVKKKNKLLTLRGIANVDQSIRLDDAPSEG